MAKFKKGDRVIATRDGYAHKKNEIGTIDEDNSLSPYVRWDKGITDASLEDDLELIKIEELINYQIY